MRAIRGLLATTIVGAVLAVAPTADAQIPSTCLAEVSGAQLDASIDFAGRVRPFAGPDGAVQRRSLRCPYRTEAGLLLELTLEWDERPADRFVCRSDSLSVEAGSPVVGVIEHPDRQAAVFLEAPDRRTLEGMEDAARITLGAVPASAAPCSAGGGAAEVTAADRGAIVGIGLVAGVALLLIVGVLWRRRHPKPVDAVVGGVDDAVRAELERTEAELARVDAALAEQPRPAPGLRPSPDLVQHLVTSCRDAPVDALAVAAIVAAERTRFDLVEVAVVARRSLQPPRRDALSSVHRDLAHSILQEAIEAADGAAGLLDDRARLIDTRRLLINRLDLEGSAR